jgi:gliding motility-associated-like protein
LTSSSGTAYLWSTGETTPGINVTTTGSYTVRVTNSSGCTSALSPTTIITVNSLPLTPVITASGPTAICEGSSISLTSSPEAVYLWSTGSTTASINAKASGNYTVQVTNSSGCTSVVSVPKIVTVNSLPEAPVIFADGPATFCEGGKVILTSGGGIGYIWSNSETTQSISVTASGSYSAKLTNKAGCQSIPSSPITVNVNALPVVNPGPDQILESEFETRMTAALSSSETGEWFLISGSGQIDDNHSPTSEVNELSSGENVFLWKVSNGSCEDSAKVKVIVHGVFVPSVITPDGDGKNDYFRIKKPEGRMELRIINKWGNEEFSSTNYLNDWDGRNNKGSELPTDTYFYILKTQNAKIIKGSVLIKR